jgi:hypothetical protein
MIELPSLVDFTIIDETDDYAVVDKPSFLLIHPTKQNGTRTLWQELRGLFAFEMASGGQVSIWSAKMCSSLARGRSVAWPFRSHASQAHASRPFCKRDGQTP